MATDTVKIGGKPVSKKVLYGGGAVALGVVGYAWYTSSVGGTATIEPDEEPPEPVPEPTDEPGFDVVGGGPPPSTNADWNAKAIQSLLNIGYDAVAAQAAIGKFLQRRSLTSTEAALVEAAIAAAGYPPENGPWVIIRDQPGQVVPPATLPAPTGARASLLRWNGNIPIYRISWNPVNGAKDYHVKHVGGSQGFQANTSFDNQGSAPGKVDTWQIAARGVDNQIGPYASLAFTAASKSPSGVLAAPARVSATAIGGGKARITWTAVPGAGHYDIRSRGIVGSWKTIGNVTSYTTVAKWRPGTKLSFEVRANGYSPSRISNAIIIK
jgi:hypothetical protein